MTAEMRHIPYETKKKKKKKIVNGCFFCFPSTSKLFLVAKPLPAFFAGSSISFLVASIITNFSIDVAFVIISFLINFSNMLCNIP